MRIFQTAAYLGASVMTGIIAVPVGAATIDTTTQGNWIGVYGGQGYILNDYNRVAANSGSVGVYDSPASVSNDLSSLPSYVSSYSYSGGFQQYVWASNQMGDVRDPQDPRNSTGPRIASTSFISNNGNHEQITLNLTSPQHFQLGVYGLDWDNFNGRDVLITIGSDSVEFNNTGAGGAPAGAYHNGEWGIFNINAPAGPLVIDVVGIAGGNSNSVLSAITFDSIPEPASIGLLGAAGLGLLARRRGGLPREKFG